MSGDVDGSGVPGVPVVGHVNVNDRPLTEVVLRDELVGAATFQINYLGPFLSFLLTYFLLRGAQDSAILNRIL